MFYSAHNLSYVHKDESFQNIPLGFMPIMLHSLEI